jgi:putative flippase GtrA
MRCCNRTAARPPAKKAARMVASQNNPRKVLGFLACGALAGATYASAFVVISDQFGMPPFFASVLAYMIAIPVSYFGNRWVTYRSRNMMAAEALRFMVVQVSNLFLTSAIAHLLSELVGFSPRATGVVVAFLVAPLVSFVLFEIWVYRARARSS